MTYAHRVDSNQAEIVETLRQTGMSVLNLSKVGHGCPDLLVAFRGRMYLLEIKSEGGKLNKAERDFRESWRAPVYIVYSIDQALDVIMDDFEE